MNSFRILLAIILFLALSLPAAASAETQKKVAILPFEILAPQQMAYLREGVRVMLASRLASGAGVTVVDRAQVDAALPDGAVIASPDQARGLATKFGADYLVTGTLTAMGGGVSIDAKVFDAAGSPAQSFFATAPQQSEVIKAVDQLAWDIAAKVFGKERPGARQVAPIQAPDASATAQSPYQTAHPERAFMMQGYGASYGMGSPFIRPGGVAPAGFVKSQNFSFPIQAMDVGDVDGDGNNEVVLADRGAVHIYRQKGNRFGQIAEFSTLARYKIHGVFLADLNGNGRQEVYVSAADTEDPNSFAVEWNGKEFDYLFREAPWYIKTLLLPGEGEVLLGQKSAVDGPLQPGVYRLAVDQGVITEGAQFQLPRGVNLFDFAAADLDGDGVTEIVTIDQHDRLKVMRPSGKLLWKSDEHYGGTTRFIGGQKALGIGERVAALEDLGRVYVPSRIIIADVNQDGVSDVIINKNLSTASRIFKNMKSYPSGEIHALSWNGIALSELWHTRKIDGYIADYQLLFADQGDSADLYVGLILRSGALDILSENESTVLMYHFDLTEEASEETP